MVTSIYDDSHAKRLPYSSSAQNLDRLFNAIGIKHNGLIIGGIFQVGFYTLTFLNLDKE